MVFVATPPPSGGNRIMKILLCLASLLLPVNYPWQMEMEGHGSLKENML